jgi:hypothetical protein
MWRYESSKGIVMNYRKVFFLIFALNITGCASMVWHEGSMIQYSNIAPVENNQFSIEVLGGWEHDKNALERAVLKKSNDLCKGDSEIISSEISTYFSSTTGGGVNVSGHPPKITSKVRCLSKAS